MSLKNISNQYHINGNLFIYNTEINNNDFKQLIFRFNSNEFFDIYLLKNEHLNTPLKGIIQKGADNFLNYLLTEVKIVNFNDNNINNELYFAHFILKNKSITKFDYVYQLWFKTDNDIFYIQYLVKSKELLKSDLYNHDVINNIIIDLFKIKDDIY